jgi:shikimate kinase
MVITLIGYRGCGKSTVGPLLAESLGYACIDSDDQVEQIAAKSIAQIFADDGEPTFRKLETQVLTDLLGRDDLVVAAGGGAILADHNRQLMRQAGPVIWLQADVATLAARIGTDGSSAARRPGLTGKSAVDEVAEVLNARLPLYSDAATITIDTADQTPQQITQAILAALDQAPHKDQQS